MIEIKVFEPLLKAHFGVHHEAHLARQARVVLVIPLVLLQTHGKLVLQLIDEVLAELAVLPDNLVDVADPLIV